jgi:mannosyltransferase PIG-V
MEGAAVQRSSVSASTRPFWTLVGIRVAFWLGTAFTLLWAPIPADRVPPFSAYDSRTDLLFGTFAQWDAQWFMRVAEDGYDALAATVFFPLYPLVVHVLGFVLHSTLVAGVLVSLVAAGLGATAIAKLGTPLAGRRAAHDGVLLLALFPTAFVFTAPQSDGLFLALSAWALLAAHHKHGWLAGLLAALSVATRLLGLALVPALIVAFWPRPFTPRGLLRLAPLLLVPLALAAYALFLQNRFGDAFAFVHAQQTYWVRDVPTLGPLGGLWDSLAAGWHGAAELGLHLPPARRETEFAQRDQVAAWNALHALLLLIACVLTVVAWRRLGAWLGVYSAAMITLILIAPPPYFPLASFPRYLLGDFPLFLALAALLETRPRARTCVLFAFSAVGAVAAVAYSRKVWIG